MSERGISPDLQGLLDEVEQMQRQIAETQDELSRREVSGSAGSGLVTARVSGTGGLVALSIDPRILRAGDPSGTAQAVADLVVTAVRNAERSAAILRRQAMAPIGVPDGWLDGNVHGPFEHTGRVRTEGPGAVGTGESGAV